MNNNMDAITWVIKTKGLSPAAWRVLMVLAVRVNSERGDFDVWPSHKQIAEDSEMSVASVKRHISDLVDKGFLSIEPQTRDGGAKTSNCYRLAVISRHQMPNGTTIDVRNKTKIPIAQNELGHSSPVNHAQFTAELCKEPLKRTSEIGILPPLPAGEGTPSGRDLFGEPEKEDDDRLIEQVVGAWNDLVKRVPAITKIVTVNSSRRAKILARAKECKEVAGGRWNAWKTVIENIEKNAWLCGEEEPGKNYRDPMKLDIDYVLRPQQFTKILEGGYRANRTSRTHDPITGRRYGPAEQVSRDALARLRGDDGLAVDRSGGGVTHPGDDRPASRTLRSGFDRFRAHGLQGGC